MNTLADNSAALAQSLGLIAEGARPCVTPLTGGVSSDIALVKVQDDAFCVKFALPKLRVEAEWHADVRRTQAEYAWLEMAARAVPKAVPKLRGFDISRNGFAMDYVSGPQVRLWKSDLFDVGPRSGDASKVGATLGEIHAHAAIGYRNQATFDNWSDFHALRMAPFFEYLGTPYPELSAPLQALVTECKNQRLTVIHGDVSPKNILFDGDQPVFLDAECATVGDPAFDIAFCLTHLLLKALHLPQHCKALGAACDEFWAHYADKVTWEAPEALKSRVALLLPAIILARVDGKSPVDYLTADEQAFIRDTAPPLISARCRDLDLVKDRIVGLPQ